MARVQGVKEKLHSPLYDAFFVKEDRRFTDFMTDPRVIRFFVDVQNKIYKQWDIRDNLVVEASRLEAFEVNATEHMGTVTRRRDQLINRLAPFRSLEKK